MAKKLPPVLIELKPSKITLGEVGVFAARDLKEGTIVGDVQYLNLGDVYKWAEYDSFDSETKNKIDAFCLGTEQDFACPVDFNYLSVPWYFNHECEGKVGFDDMGNFVLISHATKGEELTYDYSLAEINPKFSMHCTCGSTRCRKIVSGNDWKNDAFRKKYKNFFLPEVKKLL